jgi:hypothetical protein
MGPAVVAFFRGDVDGALLLAQEWVERAREADDSYELAHALILHGSALQGSGQDGAAVLEEAVRIGRDGGIASALSIGLTSLAMSVPIVSLEEAPRALALLDEAIEVGTTIGDRQAVSSANMTKATIANQLGQWNRALRAIADAAEQHLQLGLMTGLAGAYWVAALSFVGLGHLEPAAVLFGAANAANVQPNYPEWAMERRKAADAAILQGLGEDRLAELRDRGAGFVPAAAVAYLRAEADRVLGDEPAH